MASLQEQIPAIIQSIEVTNKMQILYNKDLLNIYEGDLLPYIEDSMRAELSPKAFERARKRISPINLLPKLIDKISKLYSDPVCRTNGNDDQQTLLDHYAASMGIDEQLSTLNKMTNLHKYAALEVFIDGSDELKTRVLPADRFSVWSDDDIDPTNPTHFIKFMGKVMVTVPNTDRQGRKTQGPEAELQQETNLYHIYTADEFAIVTGTGQIIDIMENPYGFLNFVYVNLSNFELIPIPNSDTKDMTILIPKLLSDLNYTVQFQSHSIMYGIDVDADQLEGNPDSFWHLKSSDNPNGTPQIGTIKPEADVDKVLQLIETETSMWFDARGIKMNSTGSMNAGSIVSGVSKMIDSADITEIRKEQTKVFANAERKLWEVIGLFHNFIGRSSEYGLKNATDEFVPTITFSDQKVIIDPKEQLDAIVKKLENGLTSKRAAIRAANPELDEEEVEQIMKEIAEEAEMSITLITPTEDTEEETE